MRSQRLLLTLFVSAFLACFVVAQTGGKSQDVPQHVRFGGALKTVGGSPRAGSVPVIFAIYAKQSGGAPLWQETQNVVADSEGRYTVLLGSVNPLPRGMFIANEARWLGVQVLADAEAEQPRVMLVSVPYALKAQDAETLGGLPPSAYLRADEALGTTQTGSKLVGQAAAFEPDGNVVTVDPHTVNAIPKFSATDTLADSLLFEQYNQVATDAFGQAIAGNEDVVRLGDGSGLRKRLQVAGRMVAEGFDINSSLVNSVRIVNSNVNGLGMQLNNIAETSNFTRGLLASARSGNAIGVQGYVFSPLVPSVAGVDFTYAIVGLNENPQGVGLFGWNGYNGAGGDGFPSLTDPIGVYASVAHSTGTAAVFDQRAAGGGKIISARAAGTEVIGMTSNGNITATGTITANAFSGDGSGLTGVGGTLAGDPAACPSNQFVTDISDTGALTCAQPSTANLSDGASLATTTYVDTADNTLAAPQYVALASSAALPNERVLTAGDGISLTDGGAGGAVTIANKVAFAQTSIQGGDTISNFPSGGLEFATTYTIPANTLTVGSVIEVWSAGLLTNGASGNSFGFGLKLGTTVLIPGNAGIFVNANFAGIPWTLEAKIICTSVAGSTATLEAQGVMTGQTAGSSFAVRNQFNSATISVDPTVAQELKVYQGVVANDVADSATMRQLIVKILK